MLFPEAGIALLKDIEPRPDELWCRCDHGPHGYLSIAAHAHADALSIELRHGGIDILCDPGTYCYQTEPGFRRYFRSTIGHNTLEIGGADQAPYGGSFLWLADPRSRLIATAGLDEGAEASWSASHSGYARAAGRPVHERSVTLERTARRLRIRDRILGAGPFRVRLAFHLGPEIRSEPHADAVALRWLAGAQQRSGRLRLPPTLAWRSWCGSKDPVLGWYSPAFGERVPTTSWIGEGTLAAGVFLDTSLEIDPDPPMP